MKLFTLLLTIICILGFALNNANAGLRGGASAIQKSRLPPSNDELCDRWSSGGSTSSYSYGGNSLNRGGYISNPSSSAINNAQRNGALNNYEATRLGINNYRNGRCTNCDENEETVGQTYRSGGHTMNSRGYLANPSRSNQIKARNAGALTNSEARSMGLNNYRGGRITNDEMEEMVGRPGFIGSTFRHSVNNQRPEVQRANRRGFIKGMQATFKNPGDIPTSKSSAAQKGFELGVNMHKNGYGSKGMGNWDEMDNGESADVVHHTPTGKVVFRGDGGTETHNTHGKTHFKNTVHKNGDHEHKKTWGNKEFTATFPKNGGHVHTYKLDGKIVKKVVFSKNQKNNKSSHTWDTDEEDSVFIN